MGIPDIGTLKSSLNAARTEMLVRERKLWQLAAHTYRRLILSDLSDDLAITGATWAVALVDPTYPADRARTLVVNAILWARERLPWQ
jgi:hypothetical protein